jgi:hypothetical protein
MNRPPLAAALAALLALEAPADAASCRYGPTAEGHCAARPHRFVRAHGLGSLRAPIEAPPPLHRQTPVALPGLTQRPVRLGLPPVAPNAPNNLPPVNAPQPVP